MRRDLFSEAYAWRGTRRFLQSALRVNLGRRTTGHWHGGPPTHQGARCYCCKKPLRLDWNLDLQDPKLPEQFRTRFPNLTRLPLYYCFNCPEATTYQVKSD